MLAAGVLSIIVVVTALLGRYLLDSIGGAADLLIIGLVVIGRSGAGGWWLKQVVVEAES